jgi:hypothetical protein
MRGVATDLTGKRYGNLLVVGCALAQGPGTWWHCACDCGRSCVKPGKEFTKPSKAHWSHSCGCRTELAASIGKNRSSPRNAYLRSLRK